MTGKSTCCNVYVFDTADDGYMCSKCNNPCNVHTKERFSQTHCPTCGTYGRWGEYDDSYKRISVYEDAYAHYTRLDENVKKLIAELRIILDTLASYQLGNNQTFQFEKGELTTTKNVLQELESLYNETT